MKALPGHNTEYCSFYEVFSHYEHVAHQFTEEFLNSLQVSYLSSHKLKLN